MVHRYAVLSLSTLLFLVPCSRLFAEKNQQHSNQQQSAPAPTLRAQMIIGDNLPFSRDVNFGLFRTKQAAGSSTTETT